MSKPKSVSTRNNHICLTFVDLCRILLWDFRVTATYFLSFASLCCQITIEPPLGLRANLLVAYSSKPISQDNFYYHEELEKAGDRRVTEFQRLVYGLSFFHGVVLERHRYGPTGWNGSYTFNMSDLSISLNQMRDVLFKVCNMFALSIQALVHFQSITYVQKCCI